MPALPIDVLIEKLDHLKKELGTLPGKGLSETQAGYGLNGSMAVPLTPHEDVADMEQEARLEAVADTEPIPPAPEVVSGFDAADDPEILWGKIIDAVARKKPSVASNMAKCRLKEVKDNTLDNLATKYVVALLGNKRSTHTIYYKGYRGFLSYGIGNTSIVGNGFLLAYPEYDFIVDVSYRGTMSLRANNLVSVAQS